MASNSCLQAFFVLLKSFSFRTQYNALKWIAIYLHKNREEQTIDQIMSILLKQRMIASFTKAAAGIDLKLNQKNDPVERVSFSQ